jgi:ribosomal protein L32
MEVMIVFCSNCGETIFDVNFCPKCGVRTMKGVEENVPIPRQRNWEEELESAVETIGEEMERAFTIAGSELKKALHRTKESLSSTEKKGVVCTKCGETNQNDTNYCYKCGTKLNG